jgi:membrane-bound lytic murein transglycosylase D
VPRRAYRVRSGDNLTSIAKANKVSVGDLQRWNNLGGKRLKAGQMLVMQGGAKPAKDQARAQADDSKRSTRYTVRKGDSYYLVAKRFNVPPQHLKRWNPRLGKALRPGQTLTVYTDR